MRPAIRSFFSSTPHGGARSARDGDVGHRETIREPGVSASALNSALVPFVGSRVEISGEAEDRPPGDGAFAGADSEGRVRAETPEDDMPVNRE